MLTSPALLSSVSSRSASTRANSWRSCDLGSRPGSAGAACSRTSSGASGGSSGCCAATSSVACCVGSWTGPVLFEAHGFARRGRAQLVGAELDFEFFAFFVPSSAAGCGASSSSASAANESVSVGTTPVELPKSSSAASTGGGAARCSGGERAQASARRRGAVVGAATGGHGPQSARIRLISSRAGGQRSPRLTISRMRCSSSRLACSASNTSGAGRHCAGLDALHERFQFVAESPIARMPAMRAPPFSVCTTRFSSNTSAVLPRSCATTTRPGRRSPAARSPLR